MRQDTLRIPPFREVSANKKQLLIYTVALFFYLAVFSMKTMIMQRHSFQTQSTLKFLPRSGLIISSVPYAGNKISEVYTSITLKSVLAGKLCFGKM